MASWFGDIKKKLQDTMTAIEQQMQTETPEENEQPISETGKKEESKATEEAEKENESDAIEGEPEEVSFIGGKGKGLLGGFDPSKFLADTTAFASKQLDAMKTAVDKSMLGELNKEQSEFERQLEEERKKNEGVTLPWHDLPDENLAKKKILALSLDSRNFLRDSPGDSEFSAAQQEAMAALLIQQDPNLGKVRFQLVPKKLTEQKFWANYFYRVGLIRQSILMAERPAKTPEPAASEKTVADKAETSTATAASSSNTSLKDEIKQMEKEEKKTEDNKEDKPKSAESSPIEEDWEKELLADLNEYEMVASKNAAGKDDEKWEQEIQDLLKESDN